MPQKMILFSIGLVLVGIFFLGMAFFVSKETKQADLQLAVENSGVSNNAKSLPEKCIPPTGVSKEAWQEHMSHHPNQYRECL